ncbi:MAG: hypothetical protein HF314_09940 [Ignavibacteria bacterium]|jgi:hypothetical protein|nr:hypothetical protein [Ignavibacteria bacterium]MCU7503386.1 hypothetical protein [Ignavibacteria bacterium]MCU7518146.1 hypothetical protein [Ignavibacteria bacterium]
MNQAKLNITSYAFNIQLESLDPGSGPLEFDTLLRVFSKLKSSFRSFIEIEFLKNETFKSLLCRKPGILEAFKKETELMVLSMDIDSLRASIAPNLAEHDDVLFEHEILCWKREKFQAYKDDVIYLNYLDASSVRRILDSYSSAERIKIYKPVFDIIAYDKDYKISLLDAAGKCCGMIVPPPDVVKRQIIQPSSESLKAV